MRIDSPQIFGGALPEWTSAGTIQAVGIGATTTAPTVPTNPVINSIQYKQIGAKTHRIRGIYQGAASQTGGAAGNGDYLLTLPLGLQFDSTVPGQAFYSANPLGNDSLFLVRGIPGSSAIFGVAGSTFSAGWPTPAIIPWDATRYRISAGLAGNSTYCWQSGWFNITSNNLNVRWEFEFQST